MKTGKSRVLIIAILVVGTMALSALAMSTNASAAGIAGTWVSREAGKGYTQTYMGPSGSMVTEYFDIELVLSGSGSSISGTLTSTGYGHTQSYPVDGTFDGTTFLMTAYYGWDGVNYLTPVYTLAVNGDMMYGSASYLNVGVTIYGTFDLKKEGLFSIGGIAPMVSSAAVVVSIVAIVVAATPPKVSPGPRGYQPQTTRVPSPPSRYEPSQQWTTETPMQPMTGDGTVPIGGVGLTYGATAAARPMTDAEARAAKAIPKSQRNNAIGIAAVAMLMAVMVLFVEDEVAMIMPLFFCFVGLGLAVQARKSAGVVGRALAAGTVTDVRTTPKWARTGNCDLGGFSVARSSQMKKLLADGVPVVVTILPEAKQLLSVNGVPLRKPVAIVAPAGFESTLASRAAAQAPRQVPAAAADQEDIPPPPDDWAAGKCPRCGKNIPVGAAFCDSCGFKLR